MKVMIARRIRQLIDQGRSNEQIAKALGVPVPAVCDIRGGIVPVIVNGIYYDNVRLPCQSWQQSLCIAFDYVGVEE